MIWQKHQRTNVPILLEQLLNRCGCRSWFKDEQPSTAIKKAVETKLDSLNWQVDCVLSHTCPSRIEPTEAYLKGVDQTTVDKGTELWLSEIEGKLTYKKWYCGHWHISKRIERFQFMFQEIEPFSLRV